jgi:Raf kinase inhibitor-like YbhB/YbcL family protein
MKRLLRLVIAFWGVATFLWAGGLSLESPDLSDRLSLEQVYDGYRCGGKNISPELLWHGEPKGTKSFAVTMFDPDAPTGHGWWHWIVVNIPVHLHTLPKGAGDPSGKRLPAGAVQTLNDFRKPGYGGACPPKGDAPHRYIVTVYALDVEKLPVTSDTSPARAVALIEKHAIAKASLTSRYGR